MIIISFIIFDGFSELKSSPKIVFPLNLCCIFTVNKEKMSEKELKKNGVDALLSMTPNQLCVGLYIILDLPWFKHPFLFHHFLIKNERQIKILKNLNLEEIIYDPQKSIAQPLSEQTEPIEEKEEFIDEEITKMFEEKKKRIERQKVRRAKIHRCESKYNESMASVKKIISQLRRNAHKSVEVAEVMIGDMVESFIKEHDMVLQLVNAKGREIDYSHVINVTVLSLALGKELGLNFEELNTLGISAIFHDIGKSKLPAKVLRKKGPWTKAELEFYQKHPEYGLELAETIGDLHPEVLNVIAQHHEAVDGTGFPKGLTGDKISFFSKIVYVADTYDAYCNSREVTKSMTPYETVSLMFARENSKSDERILTQFISTLGIYPPGTIVELSDGNIGMVISINTGDLLNPNLILYSPDIPKEEAFIIDMREEELEIEKSIRPATLQKEIYLYLNAGINVNHYFDDSKKSAK